MRTHIALALLLVVLPATAQAGKFRINEWYEHWKTPTYQLRYNYYRDADVVLHVKNGELLCYDGGFVTDMGDDDVIPLVHPIWEYNREKNWENMAMEPSADAFHKIEKVQENHYAVLYFEPEMEIVKTMQFDVTGAPKMVKEIDQLAKDYCSGKRKPDGDANQPAAAPSQNQ